MGDTLCCLEGWKEAGVKVEEDKFPTSVPSRGRPSSARPNILEDIREEGLWFSISGGVHRPTGNDG